MLGCSLGSGFLAIAIDKTNLQFLSIRKRINNTGDLARHVGAMRQGKEVA